MSFPRRNSYIGDVTLNGSIEPVGDGAVLRGDINRDNYRPSLIMFRTSRPSSLTRLRTRLGELSDLSSQRPIVHAWLPSMSEVLIGHGGTYS